MNWVKMLFRTHYRLVFDPVHQLYGVQSWRWWAPFWYGWASSLSAAPEGCEAWLKFWKQERAPIQVIRPMD